MRRPEWVSESPGITSSDCICNRREYSLQNRDPNEVKLPDTYILKQNLPNPFNPTTTLNFALPEQELVTLTVYNQLGQPVRMLLNGDESAGYKSVVWDGRNDAGQLVGTGIYFYQIRAGNFSQTRKMILLK